MAMTMAAMMGMHPSVLHHGRLWLITLAPNSCEPSSANLLRLISGNIYNPVVSTREHGAAD